MLHMVIIIGLFQNFKIFLKVKLSEKVKKGLIIALSAITGLTIGHMLRYFV